MENMREVISLQFGHYSNFVGSHFWNIQELSFDYTGKKESDVDHDILYREGSTIDGKVTYTPRLILTDLKGSLKTLPLSGGLDGPLDGDVEWPSVEKKEDPKAPKNQYLKYLDSTNDDAAQSIDDFNFETDVDTWTDYLYPRFHHRTVNIVNEYQHQHDEVPFETYFSGQNVWRALQFSESFSDNIRFYAEECNNIQGFQITMDSTDGFAGLASGCLQHIVDEYSNKAILAFPLIASYFSDNSIGDQKQRDAANLKDSSRVVNLALLYEFLFENTSLFVPICCGERGWRKPGNKRSFYNLEYNSEIYYHTSAIIAAALDTISLKYRQKINQFTMNDICTDLSGFGRRMAAASLGLPFDIKANDDLIDHLDRLASPLWTSITPSCKIGSEKVFQHLSLRGIPERKLKRPIKDAKKQLQMAAFNCSNVKEMFELYLQCNNYACASNVTTFQNGLEIKTPFPNLFSKDLDKNGFVKEFVNNELVETVPVIAGLHNGNFLFETLESLCREAKRIKIGKLHKFAEEGLEADDFTECLDKIAEMQSNYEDNYEL